MTTTPNELGSWVALSGLVLMAVVVMPTDVGTDGASAPGLFVGHEQRGLSATPHFAWWHDRVASGVITIYIDISEQEATVYRNHELIGWATASTGRRGWETPLGSYSILNKRKQYRSLRYGGMPMPYMQRLTDDGIAIHGGLVPNYPASRGCIRLPLKFSKELYSVTDVDTKVVVF